MNNTRKGTFLCLSESIVTTAMGLVKGLDGELHLNLEMEWS